MSVTPSNPWHAPGFPMRSPSPLSDSIPDGLAPRPMKNRAPNALKTGKPKRAYKKRTPKPPFEDPFDYRNTKD